MHSTITALTSGPQHHFYGYYGIQAWDRTGRYHLALETEFHEHRPQADDLALVGLVDRLMGAFIPYNATPAFNLQQGSMMHWIQIERDEPDPNAHEHSHETTPIADCASCSCTSCDAAACTGTKCVPEEFTFNAIKDGRLISYAVNPTTKTRHTIDGAIAAVSPTAPTAIGLNYLRMAHCRPVVGYASDLPSDDIADVPTDDGLFHLDLKDGHSELLLSIADIAKAASFEPAESQRMWFNHVLYNPSGERLLFFCRATRGLGFVSSLWTVNADGSDLRCQIPFGHKVSHFAWIDDERLLISTDVLGPMQFVTFRENKEDFVPYGNGKLPPDGHACFSPDSRRLVVDAFTTTSTHREAKLMLYDTQKDEAYVLGQFQHPGHFIGDIRCDLHPRWSPDGQRITFDSVHEGTRQIYVAELQDFV